MAWWLSWLERRPVTAEVVGSNPIRVVYNRIMLYIWDLSSAGRASALQAEGHRFEPCRSHLYADMAQWQSSWFVISRLLVRLRLSAFYWRCFISIILGRIPEWPKGTDCKSAGYAFEGSNPSPPIQFYFLRINWFCVTYNVVYQLNNAG